MGVQIDQGSLDIILPIIHKVASGAAGYWPESTRNECTDIYNKLTCNNCRGLGWVVVDNVRVRVRSVCPKCSKEV